MLFRSPYCAGIPGKVRVIYIPGVYFFENEDILKLKEIKIKAIEKDTDYKAYYFDPRKGRVFREMSVEPDKSGEWIVPGDGFITTNPSMEDWVLVLESRK